MNTPRSLWRAATALITLSAACRGRVDGDFAVVPGVEPAGTCAVEGYLRGDTAPDGPVAVALTWTDDVTRAEGGGTYAVTTREGRFRVAGLPCVNPQALAISVRAEGGRGGALHSTLGGVVAQLVGRSRDRLTHVRVDLTRGHRFRGVVRDARSGAPVGGVTVSAMYQGFGRDGWSRPREFAVSDGGGAWRLHGVQRERFQDAAHPRLMLYRKGYRVTEVEVALPSGDAEAEVSATLTPEP